jgi:hypothetical protein
MAILDKALELGKKVGETTASVAKSAAQAAREKSEQAIEVGKLKKDILVENGKISKLYSELGRQAFEVYRDAGDYAALAPLCRQVGAGLARIEECKEKIEAVKLAAGSDGSDGSDGEGKDDPSEGAGEISPADDGS